MFPDAVPLICRYKDVISAHFPITFETHPFLNRKCDAHLFAVVLKPLFEIVFSGVES